MRSTFFCRLGLIGAITMMAFGCSRSEVSESGSTESPHEISADIAVIDVNEVARQIGAMDKIQLAMAEFQLDLNTKLAEYQDQLDEELAQKKATLNNDLNELGKDELDSMLVKYQASLAQQTSEANSLLSAHHNQLKVKLLKQVRPIAYQIATERGMSLVLTTSQIYAAGPTSDITIAVIERIQEINAKAATEGNAQRPTRIAELPGGGEFKPY